MDHQPQASAASFANDRDPSISTEHVSARDLKWTGKTITELNLSVLRRYLPSIHSLNLVVANAVVYTFSVEAHAWEKANVEGTLFLCEQTPGEAPQRGLNPPSATAVRERACVFVLNRRGLDNVIVELGRVATFELTDELINLQLEDEEGCDGPRILGMWLHAESSDTRRLYGEFIHEIWQRIRRQHPVPAQKARDSQPAIGPAMHAMGRRLSLVDLFGHRPDATE